jgi:aspartokinase
MGTLLPIHQIPNAANEFSCAMQRRQATHGSIRSIEFKKGLSIVTIISTRQVSALVFLQKVFEVFEQQKIRFDFVTVSEIAVSVVLDDLTKLQEVARHLQDLGEVKLERGKASVCLQANELFVAQDFAPQIFDAIEKVNVCLISQSDKGKRLALVVSEGEIDVVAFALFEKFFEKSKGTDTQTSHEFAACNAS